MEENYKMYTKYKFDLCILTIVGKGAIIKIVQKQMKGVF